MTRGWIGRRNNQSRARSHADVAAVRSCVSVEDGDWPRGSDGGADRPRGRGGYEQHLPAGGQTTAVRQAAGLKTGHENRTREPTSLTEGRDDLHRFHSPEC